MFASIKRLLGSAPAGPDDGLVLANWAKAEGHTFKRVKGKSDAYVVESGDGWRVELGASKRPYIVGKELRFRCDTGVSGDVQMILLTKVLAQTLESDVFSRFTNAMQTQIDNTLPDEMRWLAMHQRVSLGNTTVLAKRFALLSNADAVAQKWLNTSMVLSLDEAASTWWTDGLMMVLTLNRGIVTMRMTGQSLQPIQLKLVGDLFNQITYRLREVARDKS